MRQKSVHQYDKETGNFIVSFESVSLAASLSGADGSHIRKAALGERVSAGGYKWSYECADNIGETNVVNLYALQRGIDPSTIVRSRITESRDGSDRISIETKSKPSQQSIDDLSVEVFQKKQKVLQRKTDELNVTKKYFREYARVENTLTALNEALNEQLTNQTFKPITYEHPDKNGTVLVVQVTDLHFNELVEMPDNEYGFVVGAQRLQKYANTIHKIAKTYDVSEIVVALTGDVINSDRRLDEKLHMATNRTKASIIATQILYHFLQDINRAANLNVVSVSGNESRVNEEWGMSEVTMSDNYDYLVFNMLKMLFKESKGITFVEGDPVEQVINVNNSNILVTHGGGIKEGQAAMQQVFGKYAAKGILLDYAIFGHIHFTNITDIYSRSGSLIGNNVYSDRSLNLITKASQVVHIIEKDGTINSLKVGLQYAGDYKGYDIKDDLKAYNSKLADNTKQRTTIVKVVI
jgi:predicted phosphodiesterase